MYVRACVCADDLFSSRGEKDERGIYPSIHPTVYRARFRFRLVSLSDKGNEVGLRRPSAEQIATTTTTSQREQPVIGPPRVN